MKLFNSTVVEQVKTMKPLTTIISNNKPLNKVRGTSLLQILTVCLFSSLLVLPTVANAQAAACSATETLQTFSFPANSWTGGALTHAAYPVGVGAAAVDLTFSIVGGQPFNSGSPIQETRGAVANTLTAYHTAQHNGFYSITVSNNGLLATNNAVVTDTAVTGLTCSTVSCAAAGGAVYPAAPTAAALQSTGLIIPTLPNAGSVTLTLTCSVSATGV